MQINVGVSNRHVHLTKEIYDKLFDEDLTKYSDLHQIGEFASNEFVTLKTDKNEIENVRIVGPLRSYNQVEISRSDAYILGIKPPVRNSGDLFNSENITIIGKKGSIYLENVCIIASRHVHMNKEQANKLNLKDNQLVKIKVNNDKSGIMDAFVKVSDNGYLELHIDYDDANAFNLKNNDVVEMDI